MLIQKGITTPQNRHPYSSPTRPPFIGIKSLNKRELNHPPPHPYPHALGRMQPGEAGLGTPQVRQVGRAESGIRTLMKPYFECNPLKAFSYTLCTPYRTLSRHESQSIRTHISLRHPQIRSVHQGHSKLYNYSFAPTRSQESQKTRTPSPSWTQR